jgi:hypothetical protein
MLRGKENERAEGEIGNKRERERGNYQIHRRDPVRNP